MTGTEKGFVDSLRVFGIYKIFNLHPRQKQMLSVILVDVDANAANVNVLVTVSVIVNDQNLKEEDSPKYFLKLTKKPTNDGALFSKDLFKFF